MAYIPIQAPASRSAEFLGDIGNTILQARQVEREKERHRAALLLQTRAQEVEEKKQRASQAYEEALAKNAADAQGRIARQERGNAVAAAQKLAEQGDLEGAANLMRAANISAAGEREDLYEKGPVGPPPPPGPPGPPQMQAPPPPPPMGHQGGSAVPDGVEAAQRPMMAPPRMGPPAPPRGQMPPDSIVPPPLEPPMEMGPPPPGPPPPAQPLPNRPVIGQKMHFKGPDEGETYTIDTSQKQLFQEAQKQKKLAMLDGIDPAQLDENIRPLLPTIKQAVRAGLIGAEKTLPEIFDFVLGLEKNKNDKIAAMRPRAAPRSEEDWRREHSASRLGIQEEGAARAAMKDVLTGFGFSEVNVKNRKFNDMASALAGKPSAAMDAKIAGEFVKEAQGGTGVLSEPDMKFFWKRMGSIQLKTEQAVLDVLNGTIHPEKRAMVLDAVGKIAGRARSNLSDIKESARSHFDDSPHLSGYRDQMLATWFPDERAAIKKKKDEAAAKPDPNVDRTNKLKGGKSGALADEVLKGIKF